MLRKRSIGFLIVLSALLISTHASANPERNHHSSYGNVYSYKCLTIPSNKKHLQLAQMSTTELFNLMNTTENEIRRFLICAKADVTDNTDYVIPQVVDRSLFEKQADHLTAMMKSYERRDDQISDDVYTGLLMHRQNIFQFLYQATDLDKSEFDYFLANDIYVLRSVIDILNHRKNLSDGQSSRFAVTKNWANQTTIEINQYVAAKEIELPRETPSYTMEKYQADCSLYDPKNCDDWMFDSQTVIQNRTNPELPKYLKWMSREESAFFDHVADLTLSKSVQQYDPRTGPYFEKKAIAEFTRDKDGLIKELLDQPIYTKERYWEGGQSGGYWASYTSKNYPKQNFSMDEGRFQIADESKRPEVALVVRISTEGTKKIYNLYQIFFSYPTTPKEYSQFLEAPMSDTIKTEQKSPFYIY